MIDNPRTIAFTWIQGQTPSSQSAVALNTEASHTHGTYEWGWRGGGGESAPRAKWCLRFLEFTLFDHKVVVFQLIHIRLQFVSIHRHQDEARDRFTRVRAESPRDRTGIDEPLAFVVDYFVFVRVSGHQNVNVKLALQAPQAVVIPPRHNLVPVNNADLKLPNSDHFGFWKLASLDDEEKNQTLALRRGERAREV